ncbi:TonB-dependent receptor [Comamonas serinivorans]|uniref:TonB-dependent receptor n=2 Tax=Comamonas serinivorans TaxID=1082851 RepID=A0A1Y0ETR5_9BURK|nr:TonB-dependent receptor [Comamonas serinivorans]
MSHSPFSSQACLPLAVAALCASFAPGAQAQSQAQAADVSNPGTVSAQRSDAGTLAAAAASLPDVVISATRTPQPAAQVLADVTVLDDQAVQRSGAVNIADLLARQPGMELVRNGGPGTTSSIYIRGAETRFTAVYVNGVRVDSQSTGGAPWEAISLAQIERIEILRGPAAAVYGSDAVAGVILIYTRQGDGAPKANVAVGLGSQGTRRAEAGISGQAGAVDYALGASRATSSGFNARPDAAYNPDKDGYRNTAANARLGWQVNGAHRLEAAFSHSKMDAQYDGFGTQGIDEHGVNQLTTASLAWAARWSEVYDSRLSVSQSTTRYRTSPDPYATKTTLRDALFQNTLRLGAHRLSLTLEHRGDALVNDPIDTSRHQNALALGWGWQGGAHTLQLNLRHDRDSEFGGATTGQFAWGYQFAPNWRVTAAAGTAFRVPTLYHRFSQYGAPDLQPEKSRNVELGLRWADGGSSVEATLYQNRVRNLIAFGAAGPCADAFGCYENGGRAVYEGLTLAARHRLGSVNLSGSIDLQDPHSRDTGKLLARRAKQLLKLGADTQLGGWTLGGEFQATSHRYDNAANTSRLGGFGVLNLYASTRLAPDWQLLLRVDNLADRQYQLARGYAQAGRTAYAELRWTPGF